MRTSGLTRGARRFAPFTFGYLAVLAVNTAVLAGVSARVANRLLLARSTNLHHLARDPLHVLVASAFWLSGPWQLLLVCILFPLVLAPVERRIGSLRTAGAFAAGHLGATLLVAAGLWVALQLDAVERNVVHARDTGASYGFFAVAALMTYLVDRRLRAPYAIGLVAYLILMLAESRSFTNWGHLLAVTIGFACYPLAATARSDRAPVAAWVVAVARRLLGRGTSPELPVPSEGGS